MPPAIIFNPEKRQEYEQALLGERFLASHAATGLLLGARWATRSSPAKWQHQPLAFLPTDAREDILQLYYYTFKKLEERDAVLEGLRARAGKIKQKGREFGTRVDKMLPSYYQDCETQWNDVIEPFGDVEDTTERKTTNQIDKLQVRALGCTGAALARLGVDPCPAGLAGQAAEELPADAQGAPGAKGRGRRRAQAGAAGDQREPHGLPARHVAGGGAADAGHGGGALGAQGAQDQVPAHADARESIRPFP